MKAKFFWLSVVLLPLAAAPTSATTVQMFVIGTVSALMIFELAQVWAWLTP